MRQQELSQRATIGFERHLLNDQIQNVMLTKKWHSRGMLGY